MKKIIIFIVCVLYSNTSFAIKCASPEMMMMKYENIALIRLLEIGESRNAGEKSTTANAKIEVLKIYKGNNKLSKIENIMIHVSCDDVWGPPCEFLDSIISTSFQKDDNLIIFGDNLNIINMHVCSRNTIYIKDNSDLETFEKSYQSILNH